MICCECKALRVSIKLGQTPYLKNGASVPPPPLGEDPETYRRDLCVKAKRQLPYDHQLRKIKLWDLSRAAFEALEPQVYDACAEAAKRPDSVPPGEMRMLKTKDQNGQEIITWIGNESFVKDMGRPGRRVVSFMHRYNTSGVAFR